MTESENLPSADIRITRKCILRSEKYGGGAVFKGWAYMKQRNVTVSPRGNWKTNMPMKDRQDL